MKAAVAAIRVGFSVGVGVVFGALGLALLAGPAEALPDPCDARITLWSTSISAEVSSSEGEVAAGGGQVEFQQMPRSSTTVNLTAQTDNGYPVSIDPKTFTVQNSDMVSFRFSVTVPPAAPAGEVGIVTINARVSVNGFVCTAPSPASASIRVRPFIDVFGGTIPDDTRVKAADGLGETFDIVIDVRSNAPMRVSFTYDVSRGITAEGPAYIDVEPGFDRVTTRAVRISYHGGEVQAGINGIDIVVTGEVEGLKPRVGHLGVLVYVPASALEAGAGDAQGVLMGLGLAGLVAVPVQLQQRQKERRRAARLRLKQIMREARAAAGEGAAPLRSERLR